MKKVFSLFDVLVQREVKSSTESAVTLAASLLQAINQADQSLLEACLTQQVSVCGYIDVYRNQCESVGRY